MKIAFNPSTVAALITPPNNKDITFDLRGQNIFARGVKFCGTDTNTWRDIKINNVSIGSNILDLRNGSNTTLTNTNGVVTINSTWRPVVDNLTSDSTTSSLSANQGRVLAGLINGKSDSDHNHDDRYLKLTGGLMSGDINFVGDNRIYWGRNTDSASISFKNDRDGDDDSYMSFVTSDNGNEYFRWSHSSGSTNTEWMALRSEGLRVRGTKVSLEGHSHNDLYYTKTEVNNKFNGKSDTDHTHDDRYLKLTGGTMRGTIYKNSGGTTISGRDHAIIRQTHAPGGSSWNPIACVDTETGTWTLGHLSSVDSDTNFHFCFSTNVDYNAGNNNGNYVTLRNKVGTIALLSDIPTSLKNPYALTISLNGTSQGPYDGSAVKNINITPSSIGAATSDHNHDGRYVRYYTVTTLDCNNLAVGLTAAKTTATNTAHTNHSAYLYISDVGTPFQIQIPDSNVSYIYKRYYSSGTWSGWFKLNAGYADSAGSVAWDNVTGKPSSYIPSAHTHSWTSITDKLVAGNEFNIVNAGFNGDMYFNYLPINDRGSTATVLNYYFGNGHKGLALVQASGFVKVGSSSSYVLLGDGGHLALSSLNSSHNHDDRYLKLEGGTMNGNARIGHGSGNLYIGNSGNDGWLAVQDICSQDSIGDGRWSIRVDGTANFQSIKFPSNRLIAQVSNGSNSPLKGIKLPNLQSNAIGLFSRVGNGNDEGGIILSGDTCVIYNSFDTGWGLSVRDKDLNQTDVSSDDTVAFGIRQTYKLYSRGGFEKKDSSDDYVLLGGGGHKLESSLRVAYASNADMVDGYHENSFLRYRGATSTNQEATLWSQIGIKQYNNALPDNLTGVYNYGSVISLPGDGSRFEIYASHYSSNGSGLYYRSGWNSDKKTWLKFIDSSNISSQSVNYANSAGNADTLDGEHASSFVRAGHYESSDLNKLDTYSFIKSVNSNNSSTSPKGNTGWYNVIQLVHRNGRDDGPGYIGQIALGMTTNTNDMFFRGKRTDSWKTVIHSGNYTEFINNYYWANVKISASSSTTTSPTVHTLTATRVCAGHNPEIDNSISCSNWFRSSGNTGWYNTTYRGGWYMSDTSWVRTHNGVGIYTSGQIYSSSSIRMSNILLEHTDEINNSTDGGIHLNYRNSGNVSLCYGGGSVGIGTPTPSYKLDVNGQMGASGFHHSSVNSDNYILLAGGGYKSFGGDDSTPIFLGYLNLDHGNDGTISSSFYCLGYSVPFTYTRGGNYCRISIPDTTRLSFYINAAIASVNYSGGGMDTWVGQHRGAGAWWLHCYASGWNEVRVKGFRQANDTNESWWGGNPLYSNNDGANRITVCIFGYVRYK